MSRTTYTHFVETVSLIKPEQFTDTLVTKLLGQTLRNPGDLAAGVFEAIYAGFPPAVGKMVRYGKRDYLFGLPGGQVSSFVPNKESTRRYLAELHPQTNLTLTSVAYRQKSIMEQVEDWLRANYFNTATNAFWTPQDVSVRLPAGSVPNHPYTGAAQTLVPNKLSAKRLASGIVIFGFTAKVWTVGQDSSGNILVAETLIFVQIGQFNALSSTYYYVIEYVLDDTGEIRKLVIDPVRENNHWLPVLAPVYKPGSYMPLLILLQDRRRYDADENSKWYKDTTKMLKYIKMDGKTVLNAVMESDTDKAEKYDFVMSFNCPAAPRTDGSREYLYHYFKELASLAPAPLEPAQLLDMYRDMYVAGNTPDHGEIGGISVSGFDWETRMSPYLFYLDIQDPSWNAYNARYTFSGFYSTFKSGRVLPLKKVATEITNINHAFHRMYGLYSDAHDATFAPCILITKQLTNSVYELLCVVDPVLRYQMNQGRNGRAYVDLSPGTGSDIAGWLRFYVGTKIDRKNMVFPIHIDFYKQLNPRKQEQLLQDSFGGSLFLLHERKKKWYERGIFKIILIGIVVVLIVLQQYYVTGWIAGAMAGAGAVAIMIVTFIINFLISLVISFLASLVSPEFAMIVTIFTFMLGAANALEAAGGDIMTAAGNAWKSLVNSAGTWGGALDAISKVTGFIAKVHTQYVQNEMEKLQSEMADWSKTAKERQEELDDKWYSLQLSDRNNMDVAELLDTQTIDSQYPSRKIVYPHESVQSFFTRMLMMNPGAEMLGTVQHFCSMGLMLPAPGLVENPMTSINRPLTSPT